MDKTLTMTVSREDDGRTVEALLKDRYGLSRKEISRLKFSQGIRVNGEQNRVSTILHEADVLALIFREAGEEPVFSSFIPEILYEDEDVIIAYKPAGMPCHRSHGHLDDDLGTALQNLYPGLTVRPVGRLDKDVSGLMVYAKNTVSAARLNRQREEGILQKAYTAVCEGQMEYEEGEIRTSLVRVEGERARQEDEAGKSCISVYRVLKRLKGHTVLQIHLETGRTHQIRAGFAHAGHPLAGDALYKGHTDLIKRPALHCGEVTLVSPFTKKKVTVNRDLPDDIALFLDVEE